MNPAPPKNTLSNVEIGNRWYYTYLLKSRKTKWIYIGCTDNLKRRLIEHSEGKNFSTKRILPVELIYFEAYNSKEYAYRREKFLKRYGSSLAKLKERIGLKSYQK